MMRLDYGTQLSPDVIEFVNFSIRKPTLRDISKLGFDRFVYYEFLAKLTPEKFIKETDKDYDGSSVDIPDALMDLIAENEQLQAAYQQMLNFFIIENVAYCNNCFWLYVGDVESIEKLTKEQFKAIITRDSLQDILCLIQQICCIDSPEEDVDNLKFKNEIARKLYLQMQEEKKKIERKSDNNLSLPNIISSVANFHQSLNFLNIWDLTIFQLIDSFNRLRNNAIYSMNERSISVWGDAEKSFDFSLWYKNEYDNR